jgi:hypothetical protein
VTGKRRLFSIYRCFAVSFALLLVPAPLWAEPAPSACPDRAAVRSALRALSARGAHGTEPDDQLELTTADSGDSYSVSVNGRTRSYTDPSRDCGERAQVAAVFAALVLSSPNSVDSDADSPPPPVTPAPTSSLVVPAPVAKPASPVLAPEHAPRSGRLWFDAGAAVALAPGSAGPPLEQGFALGFAYVPHYFGAALGLRLPAASAHLPLGDTNAHLLRYPVDLVARGVLRAPPFRGTLDAGVVVSLLRVRQADDSGQGSQSRIEAGLRLASRWQLADGVVSPYIEVFSEVIPTRYELALEPTGPLSKTPGLWLGAALGVCAHFD